MMKYARCTSYICTNVKNVKTEMQTRLLNVTYEIKRDFYSKNDPTNVKQVSKNLKLIKRISRKRKIFFRLFIYFLFIELKSD